MAIALSYGSGSGYGGPIAMALALALAMAMAKIKPWGEGQSYIYQPFDRLNQCILLHGGTICSTRSATGGLLGRACACEHSSVQSQTIKISESSTPHNSLEIINRSMTFSFLNLKSVHIIHHDIIRVRLNGKPWKKTRCGGYPPSVMFLL